MRVVALTSGGKDSCFSIMQCVAAGHDVVALANLYPVGKDELDSFMFQTVGHHGVEFFGEAMGLPMYREPTFGRSKMQEKNYVPTEDDEVEDLYRLLKKVKDCENIEAVSSGAIASDYQRIRVENVCNRLGLTSLSYLWHRDQEELLNEMIQSSVNAIIIKVSALGLEPKHLGKSLSEMHSHLTKMKEKYGLNICGEGGEYETFTLDCPLYIKSIVINEYESVIHSRDDIAPVGYLNFKKILFSNKNKSLGTLSLHERLQNVFIKTPYDHITEILNPKEDEGDCDLSEDETRSCKPDNTKLETTISEGPLTAVNTIPMSDEYPDNPTVNENQSSWLWFGGITSKHTDAKFAMEEALNKLHNHVSKKSIKLSDIVAVTLYIKDMANYSIINEIYASKFTAVNPPVRVCVECPLNVHVVLEALAYKEESSTIDANSTVDGKIHKRHTLHVQSISHWAPANIGPYSQTVRVGDIILVAGQIPLVPGSMTLLDSDIKQQCRLTLRHVNRLLKAMDVNAQLRDIVQGICFLTNFNYIPDARKEWERQTNNAIVDYIVVPNLPRGANLEWCVWAHRDNNRFEYEETGKCVGNFKISLRRRWNYDNNVSAIVCYLSHGLFNSSAKLVTESRKNCADLTAEDLKQYFEFLLCKLKQGSQIENPTCTLRIFYKVGVPLCSKFIQNVIAFFSNQNLVITIIPAIYLYNCHTFVSVCGIRHE